MDDDDIIACILPEETPDQEGINICIQKGFRFEERLTDEEKQSMVKVRIIKTHHQVKRMVYHLLIVKKTTLPLFK